MLILEKLKVRRAERSQTAQERFLKLAKDIWSGVNVSEEVAEAVLREAEKNDSDLSAELERLDSIARLRHKLVDENQILNELREINEAERQADEEYVAYRAKFAKEAERRESRRRELRHKLEESKRAEDAIASLS